MNQHLFFIDDCPDSLISVHLRHKNKCVLVSPFCLLNFVWKMGNLCTTCANTSSPCTCHIIYLHIKCLKNDKTTSHCLIILFFKQFTIEACFVFFCDSLVSGWHAKIDDVSLLKETRHAIPPFLHHLLFLRRHKMRKNDVNFSCFISLCIYASFGFISPTISLVIEKTWCCLPQIFVVVIIFYFYGLYPSQYKHKRKREGFYFRTRKFWC